MTKAIRPASGWHPCPIQSWLTAGLRKGRGPASAYDLSDKPHYSRKNAQVQIHTHRHTPAYTLTHTHSYRYPDTHVHLHLHTGTRTDTCTHAQTRSHSNIHIHSWTNSWIHTVHSHTHMCTHSYSLYLSRCFPRLASLNVILLRL